MKQLNLLPVKALMILFVFFMVSCEDDDSEEPNANPLIGGTWHWIINERTNCGDPADEGEFSLTDCEIEGCYYAEFRADGTVKLTFTQGSTTEEGIGTYTFENNYLISCYTYEGVEECDEGEVTIIGNRFEWFKPKVDQTSCDVNHIYEKV